MKEVVVDASIALAWCFPDETSQEAEHVLVSLEKMTIVVPALWAVEIANAVLAGERTKRLKQQDVEQFSTLLNNLSVRQDVQSVAENLGHVLPVGRQYGLTAYDAAYLELSIRMRIPLATLDGKLRKAAKQAGVELFN